MQRRWLAVGAAALGLLVPAAAKGWDETGHRVVARIAWDNLTPTARARVVELLMSAPEDAGIRELLPQDSRPLEVRQRELFLRASVWPDYVRGNRTYDRGDWHYVNLFWEQPPGSRPRDLPGMPPAGKAVQQLEAFESTVASPQVPAAERAVQLAWILHLVGDIHQPLHASARVTPRYRDGDRGGNRFELEGRPNNLHSYWDQAVTREHRWLPGDTTPDLFVESAAEAVQRGQPRSRFDTRLLPGRYPEWARESVGVAKTVAYTGVTEGERPSAAYRRKVYRAAEPRVALAGYRLAEMLNRLFGS